MWTLIGLDAVNSTVCNWAPASGVGETPRSPTGISPVSPESEKHPARGAERTSRETHIDTMRGIDAGWRSLFKESFKVTHPPTAIGDCCAEPDYAH